MMPIVAKLLAALVIFLGVPAASVPSAVAQDTSAVAVNLKDGRSVFRLAFHVKRTVDTVVDHSNAAVAFASCDSCRTVAISIQVVLAMAETDAVTTENLALAYNFQCSECETLAAAYQFVFATGERLRFTPEGSRRVADIRRRLQQLRQIQLTLHDLALHVDALADELWVVLQEELVARAPAGADSATDPVAADSETTDSTTTTGGESTTSTTTDSSSTTTDSSTTTTA